MTSLMKTERSHNEEDVLSRLRHLQKRMESGKHYGFEQDIWQAAGDEIQRLRERASLLQGLLDESVEDVERLRGERSE